MYHSVARIFSVNLLHFKVYFQQCIIADHLYRALWDF
jgi:hypothetical protein